MDVAPLILLPAMGADARLFASQKLAFPELIVPPWIAPEPRELLRDYAARFAAVIDPGQPCWIGGASFGGMLAMEVARHLNVRGCILIGSIRGPGELPRRFRIFRPGAGLASWPVGLAPWMARCNRAMVGRWLPLSTREVLDQLCDADARFVRWATWAVLSWKPLEQAVSFPVHQIHGARDWILPASLTHPDEQVPGAGHLLPATHAEQVTMFIERVVGMQAEGI